MAEPRLILLGLDGATFTVIDFLIGQGRLPHLAGLMQEGVRSPLESTVPPHSAAAWPSLVTGRNPGYHGLYDFYRRRKNSYRLELINGGCVPGPKLWDYVSASGKRVCVFNVPISYPPEPLNGVMVSGMDSPSRESEFTYPAAFKQELLRHFPGYSIEIDELERAMRTERRSGNGDPRARRRQTILAHLEQQLAVAEFLLGRERWDVFFGVIVAPDRAQHLFWSEFEELRQGKGVPADSSPLLAAYERADAAIGKWRAQHPDCSWVILSDHGFGRLEKEFYLDGFLARQGWLRPRSGWERTWRLTASAARKAGRIPRAVQALVQQGAQRWQRGDSVLPPWVLSDPERAVDWSRTRAYPVGETGAIFVNLQGREPEGIVQAGKEYEAVREEIIQALKGLRDPEDGRPVVEGVYRREELFAGEALAELPDLHVCLRGYAYRVAVEPGHEKDSFFGLPRERKAALYDSGTHMREGILLAAGPCFARGRRLSSASILDVLPTVLHALGLPVEERLEGRVLVEAFAPEYLEAHPVRRGSGAAVAARPGSGYSPEEERQLAERLRQLGYLE
ncbi:MAG: alkaline phosphatase family protein [Candidatus Acidoferrales bacterium]